MVTTDENQKVSSMASGSSGKQQGALASRLPNLLKATGVILACTVIARTMLPFFELSNVVMVYILGVAVVATRYGRGASILSSVLSVAAFDFFFVPPFHTFVVADTQYLVTFAVMLTIAIVISTLTVRVRQQADAARMRELRTAALYSMSKELASRMDFEEIVDIGMEHVGEVFDCKTAVFYQDPGSSLWQVRQPPDQNMPEDLWNRKEALNAFDSPDSFSPGSVGTHGETCLYLPLRVADSRLGVLAVLPKASPSRLGSPERLQLLETFINQIALSCERARLSKEAESTHLRVKTEQLRNSLLSSVSHDLRTPLATITGAASGIMDPENTLDQESYRQLGKEIYQEAFRLNKLVGNLLEMTKVESGTLILKRDRHPVDELVGSAVSTFDRHKYAIKTTVQDGTLLVYADPVLIQQVLVNLIENAVKYSTEPQVYLKVSSQPGGEVQFEVSDCGPGIPEKNRKLVFEKFYRERPNIGTGVGLGLAICQGIVEAHGGRIWIEDSEYGGSSFRFVLPPPTVVDVREDEVEHE
ncbi:MAG: DUF4118 domain-containing protein [Candidatus Melainabacteria bacterium]|nr:DUF4118 domain-containing protein [Candidatus Melainabacteria bacterium]